MKSGKTSSCSLAPAADTAQANGPELRANLDEACDDVLKQHRMLSLADQQRTRDYASQARQLITEGAQ
jgi:hypothetical protein